MIEISCIWLRISALLLSQFIICSHTAPLPPQQITCPDGKIYALVNTTEADREPYVHVKTNAVSLSDCIHTCFGNEFCFSLRYDESEADNCTLYYFSAYNCSRFPLLLAEDIEYTGNAMTIDCIRCPSLGELVSTLLPQTNDKNLDGNDRGRIEGFTILVEGGKAPPNATVSEGNEKGTWRNAHAIVSVHEEGTKKEVKEEGKQVNEIKEMESKDGIVEQKSVDETTHEQKKTTEAESATTVEGKLEERTTETPKESAGEGASTKAEVENKEITPCLGEESSCAAPWTLTTTPTSGETAQTVKEETTKESGTATAATEEQKIEETTGKSEVSEAPKEESKEESKTTEEGPKPEEKQEETSAKEEQKTTTAATQEKVEGTEVTKPVEHSIDEEKTTAEKHEEVTVKSHGAAYYERTCVATFEVDPYADISNFEATRTRDVQGPDHCALICYTDACTAAVYDPPAATGQPGHCKMRFDGHEKCNSTLRRDYYVTTKKSVYLQCFRCLPEKPVTEPIETVTTEITAKSETPKAEEVKPGEGESEKKEEEAPKEEAQKEETKAEEHTGEGEKAVEVTTRGSAPEEGAAATLGAAVTEGGEAKKEGTTSGEGAAATSGAAVTEGGEAKKEGTTSGEGAAATSGAAVTEGGEAKKEETASGGAAATSEAATTESSEAKKEETASAGAVAASEDAATEGGEAKKEETTSGEGAAATSEAATTESSEAKKEETTLAEGAAATSEAAATEGREAKKEETALGGAAATSEAATTESSEAKKEETVSAGAVAASETVATEGGEAKKEETTSGEGAAATSEAAATEGGEAKKEETASGGAAVTEAAATEGGEAKKEETASGGAAATSEAATTESSEAKKEGTASAEGAAATSEAAVTEGGEVKKEGTASGEGTAATSEAAATESSKAKKEETVSGEGAATTSEAAATEGAEAKKEEPQQEGTSLPLASSEGVKPEQQLEKPLPPEGTAGQEGSFAHSIDNPPTVVKTEESESSVKATEEKSEEHRQTTVSEGVSSEGTPKVTSEEHAETTTQGWRLVTTAGETQRTEEKKPENVEPEEGNKPQQEKKPEEEKVGEKTSEGEQEKPKEVGKQEKPEEGSTPVQEKPVTEKIEEEKKQEEGKAEEEKKGEKEQGEEKKSEQEGKVEHAKEAHEEEKVKEEEKVTVAKEVEKPTKSMGESIDEQIKRLRVGFSRGCIVTFQADPISQRPSVYGSGFEASTKTKSAEVCAGRCYQDGCTGAKYDPQTGDCILGYGGRQNCNNGPEHFFYKPNQTVWIHCTSCRLHKPGDEGVNIMVDLARVKAEQQKTTTQPPEPEKKVEVTQAPVKEEEKKTEEAKAEVVKDSGVTTTPTPEATEGEKVTEGEQSTKAEVKPTESEEPKKVDEEKPAERDEPKEGQDKAEKKPEKEPEGEPAQDSTKAPEGNGCVIWFQVDPIAQRPKSFTSEIEIKNDTTTAEICANRCYQAGCIGARYDPQTMECALGYGDHQHCSDDQQYDRFHANTTIWIHCITCKKPLPDDRQFELLVDESEETTTFPEGVLPRRGPLTNSIPLDFTTLSVSVDSTKESSGESTAHEVATTSAEGLFTQLDAQSTSLQPTTSITENAVVSSEERTFIPGGETGEVSTVAQHWSTPFRQSEAPSETTEMAAGIGLGAAFETTTGIEGVTNRVEEAGSSTEGRKKEDKELLKPELGEAAEGKSTAVPMELSSTVHMISDVGGTSVIGAAGESEGTTLSAVKTESFTTEPRSIESSHPTEEDRATEEGHIFVSAKTTTLPERSAGEDEMSKEEKTTESSISGNEPKPSLASTDGHALESTTELPENEAEEGETTAAPSVTQSESGTIEEVQNASTTPPTSTISFEDEAFTAGIVENESTTFKQPIIITASSDLVEASITAAGSTEKLETSSTNKVTISDEPLERLQTSTVSSAQEPERLSTSSSTYGRDEKKKQSSKLPESVSAVESADETEPEWPNHDKEDEKTSSTVQSVSEEDSEQSEATTTAARVIDAGEVVVDLGVVITTTEPQEFTARQETQEIQEVSLSTSSLGESIDERVTESAKHDEISSTVDSKFLAELLTTVASSSEQSVVPTGTVTEAITENGRSTTEQNEASLPTNGYTASTSNVTTSFTDSTARGEIHSSTMKFATTDSEHELKSASQEQNVEKMQSTSPEEGQYTSSTVAEDFVVPFTGSSRSEYSTTTTEKIGDIASESDVVSKDHSSAESSSATFIGDETTTTTSVDTKLEEKIESEAKVPTVENNEKLTTLEHEKMIEATTVTKQSKYEASSSEPGDVAFITAKPEGEEEEETSSKTLSTSISFGSVPPVDERVTTSEVTDEKVKVSTISSDEQLAAVTSAEEVSKKTDALNGLSTTEITEEEDHTGHTTEPLSSKLADGTTEEAKKISSGKEATDGSTTIPSIEAAFIPDFLKKIQKTINSERNDKILESTPIIEGLNVDISNTQVTKVDERVTQSTTTEELTTPAEPPIQAVSDLVDALSQNTKLEEILGFTSIATPHDEVSTSSKISDENFSIDDAVTESEKDIAIPISDVDITNLESTQSRSVPLIYQPFIHEGTAVGCAGRLEFQRISITALPKLNVTNDVPARTPADCARKCFETEGCSLAGYIPSPTGDPTNGVCLLTTDDEVCLDNKKFVPQHASLSPFVLSCIKCSPCKYTISTVTPERKLPLFEHTEQLLTIGKCAEECSKRKCTTAKYNTNTKICSMSSAQRSTKECPHETAVQTDGVLPLLLECVECATIFDMSIENTNELDYRVIHASNYENLQQIPKDLLRGTQWITERKCTYPQQLILKMHTLSHIDAIQILGHPALIASSIDLYTAVSTTAQNDTKPHFKLLGTVRFKNVENEEEEKSELKTIYTDLIASHIRLDVQHNYSDTARNQLNQVGIISIVVLGNYCDPQLITTANTIASESNNDSDSKRISSSIEKDQNNEYEEEPTTIKTKSTIKKSDASVQIGEENFSKSYIPRLFTPIELNPTNAPLTKNRFENESTPKQMDLQSTIHQSNSNNLINDHNSSNSMQTTAGNKFIEKENMIVPAVLKARRYSDSGAIGSGSSSNSEQSDTFLAAMNPADRSSATMAITLFGFDTVRLSYSKKWKERREGLNKIEIVLKSIHESNNLIEYLDSALSIICKLLKDSLFAVYTTALDLTKYIALVFLPAWDLRKKMGLIIADRTTDILISRSGDAINDKRFPISTQDAIMEILNGPPQIAKCFVKKLLQPFRVARSARSDKYKVEIVWNALNAFNAPNRQLGLVEKPICSFALSCLHHNDPEVRNMGKNIFIYMYGSDGVDTELIRSHLPHLSKYTYEKNPLLRSLRDEFEQFDRSRTTTKKIGQAAKAEGSVKRMKVPKLEDGKRPRTVTVVVHEGRASSSNRPDSVDYDKMCMFCGEINETFTPEGLDEHYLHNCYMLTRCHLCDEVVEVSTLNEHLLDECTNKSTLRRCMRCHEPIAKNHFSQHVSTQRCKVAKSNTITGRCLLCHTNITPNNDIGWRKHLRDYCKYNSRRSINNTRSTSNIGNYNYL